MFNLASPTFLTSSFLNHRPKVLLGPNLLCVCDWLQHKTNKKVEAKQLPSIQLHFVWSVMLLLLGEENFNGMLVYYNKLLDVEYFT